MGTSVLTFDLAGERWGIALDRVREVVSHAPITRVPFLPPAIVGVANLRGRVVPVVDLAIKFGFGATRPTKWSCFLLVDLPALPGELEGVTLAVLADSVDRVSDIEQIEQPPAFGVKVDLAFLRGLVRVDNRLAMFLSIEKVLSPEELLAASSARESA
jgi:purine-binding chemotaxis protein CheW